MMSEAVINQREWCTPWYKGWQVLPCAELLARRDAEDSTQKLVLRSLLASQFLPPKALRSNGWPLSRIFFSFWGQQSSKKKRIRLDLILYLLFWVWCLSFRRHHQPWRHSPRGSLHRILDESRTRILVTTVFRFVACLKTDLTLLLTISSYVAHSTAHVTLDGGTLVASVSDLLATKTVVSGTVFCVVCIDLVTYFTFKLWRVEDHFDWSDWVDEDDGDNWRRLLT